MVERFIEVFPFATDIVKNHYVLLQVLITLMFSMLAIMLCIQVYKLFIILKERFK